MANVLSAILIPFAGLMTLLPFVLLIAGVDTRSSLRVVVEVGGEGGGDAKLDNFRQDALSPDVAPGPSVSLGRGVGRKSD